MRQPADGQRDEGREQTPEHHRADYVRRAALVGAEGGDGVRARRVRSDGGPCRCRPVRGACRRRARGARAPPRRRGGPTRQAQRGARAPPHEAVDGQSARRLQPPNGSRRQRPEAPVGTRRADVVTTTLQRPLHPTDLNTGLRAHADALREHRRGGPAGRIGPARHHRGHGEDGCNGGDETRPDGQGGQLDSHELSLLKRLKERRSAQRAPTRTENTREGVSARPLQKGCEARRRRQRRSKPKTTKRTGDQRQQHEDHVRQRGRRQPARSGTAGSGRSAARRSGRRRTLPAAATVPGRRRLPRRGVGRRPRITSERPTRRGRQHNRRRNSAGRRRDGHQGRRGAAGKNRCDR